MRAHRWNGIRVYKLNQADKKRLAKNVRAFRKTHGVKCIDIADAAKIDRKAFYNYLSGSSRIPETALAMISAALNQIQSAKGLAPKSAPRKLVGELVQWEDGPDQGATPKVESQTAPAPREVRNTGRATREDINPPAPFEIKVSLDTRSFQAVADIIVKAFARAGARSSGLARLGESFEKWSNDEPRS